MLNSRSLHRHIEDIRKDLNYASVNVNIFSETRLNCSDKDTDYAITGYTLFRNDNQPTALNTRPYGGTAVYSKNPSVLGYPVCKNTNGVEITVIKLVTIPHVTIIAELRARRRRAPRGAPLLRKKGNPSIREILVIKAPYVRTYVRPSTPSI